MEIPDIGPISPHFGLRRSSPDRRRPGQQRQSFDDAVRRSTEDTVDGADDEESARPGDLQRRTPNVRRDGRDGDRHVDVLA